MAQVCTGVPRNQVYKCTPHWAHAWLTRTAARFPEEAETRSPEAGRARGSDHRGGDEMLRHRVTSCSKFPRQELQPALLL